MGARLSSDNSESPGSSSGVTLTSAHALGQSHSTSGTPVRHQNNNSGSGVSSSVPVGIPHINDSSRLQRILIQRQHHHMSMRHSSNAGSSHNRSNIRHSQTTRSSSSRHPSLSTTNFPSSLGSRQRPRSIAVDGSSSRGGGVDTVNSDSDDDLEVATIRHQRHCISFRTDIRCRLCNKMIPPDDYDLHFVMCLTKPKISYNDDVLSENKGECAICLEDMCQGDTIARLPCLCIYHKGCIDEWFKRSQTCPEHPGD